MIPYDSDRVIKLAEKCLLDPENGKDRVSITIPRSVRGVLNMAAAHEGKAAGRLATEFIVNGLTGLMRRAVQDAHGNKEPATTDVKKIIILE